MLVFEMGSLTWHIIVFDVKNESLLTFNTILMLKTMTQKASTSRWKQPGSGVEEV